MFGIRIEPTQFRMQVKFKKLMIVELILNLGGCFPRQNIPLISDPDFVYRLSHGFNDLN